MPEQIDTWFKAYHAALTYCGTSGTTRKPVLPQEKSYLDSYIRGVYAAQYLKLGQTLEEEDVYLAIPLQKGQISFREFMLGRYGHRAIAAFKKDQLISIDMIDSPYSGNAELKEGIYKRGL